MMAGMTRSTITVYGITNCDTVKKARDWLAAEGIDYRFHDFKKEGVPPEHLARWIAKAGWDKVINRQGTTWRKLAPAEQAGVKDAASAAALAIAQPSIIKRPVVEWGGAQAPVTVGFAADRWAERAAALPHP